MGNPTDMGGKGDERNLGDMNTPMGVMNLGQWTGLTKGNRPQNVSEAYGDIVRAMGKYLPAYNQLIKSQAPIIGQTENRLRNVMQEGEKNRIGDIGQKTVRRVNAINREVNPEAYANRSAVAGNLQELMKPGLTGGEIESIRRGLRTDNVNNGLGNVESNINTVAGAMQYGNAARDRMERATSLAGSLQPNLTTFSPESTFSMASGRDIMTPGSQQSEGFGQGLLQTKLSEMGLLGQRENTYHGGLGKLAGSVCGCYIFRAHYGIDIPWWVVFARDYFHEQDPMIGSGYKRMAKWLVPLMKRWSIVRKIVDYLMIRPLTLYGGYMYNVNGFESCWVFRPIVKFWFRIWRKG